MIDKLKTGKLIKNQRQLKNYTQKDLADKLFVSDKAVSRWETGKSFPDIELLENLANELDISITDVLSGEIMDTNNDLYNKDIINIASEKNSKLKKLILPTLFIVLFSLIIIVVVSYSIFIRTYNLAMTAPSIEFLKNEIAWDILFFSFFAFMLILPTCLLIITNIVYISFNKNRSSKRKELIKIFILSTAITFFFIINDVIIKNNTIRGLFEWYLIWAITFFLGFITNAVINSLIKHFNKYKQKNSR